MIGYKIMRIVNNTLVSGANSRIKFPAKINSIIEMPGKGIYLSTNRNYVVNYYSGYHDREVLLVLSFNKNDIIWGNITDIENEVGVRKAKILKIQKLN